MTTPRPPGRLRTAAFRIFYSLPGRWRRRLVRTLMPSFIIGSVVLVRDSDAAKAQRVGGAAPDQGRLLLVRQPPGVGWSLPAGLMKRGEQPVDAARRELAEETGIELSIDEITPAVPNAVVHVRPGRWVDMVYEASVPAEGLELRPDGAEVLEVAWHRLDALPPLTSPTARLLSSYGIGPYAQYPEVRG